MILVASEPSRVAPLSGRGRCNQMRRGKNGREASCHVQASWRTGVRLYSYKDGPSVDYYFDQLRVCNSCRRALRIERVLTDRAFSYLTQRLVANGHTPPRRRLSRLVFTHLTLLFESGG